MGWLIIFGSIHPDNCDRIIIKDIIEGAFTKSLVVIAISLITLGIILAIAEKVGNLKKI